MCDPVSITMAVVGVVSAYSSYQQGQAAMSSAEAQADMLKQQGQVTLDRADKQAELIEDTAKYEGKTQALKAAELSASQRAALAANGVELGSGTAQDITMDTITKSLYDEEAIRRNADAKAQSIQEDAKYKNWALMTEADNTIFQGKQARHSANIQAGVSLVGAAVSAGGGFLSANPGFFGSSNVMSKGSNFASAGSKLRVPASSALKFGRIVT